MFNEHLINGVYDFAQFTLNNGQTNYDVKANQASLFSNIVVAKKLFLWSTQDITFRFNNTSNSAITLAVSNGESPAEFKDMIMVTNIYLTNASGQSSTIKILLGV